jgi:hypothetical protein
MSKSNKNGSRLSNPKRIFENRSKRREIKQIIKEGRFEELSEEEKIIFEKEQEFNSNIDR